MSLSFAEKLVAEWTDAVRTHAAGTLDQPLKTVASWPPEHATLVVRMTVERLHRFLEAREFVYTQEVAELTGTLLRGLSLHTDIAIAQRNSQAPMGRPGAVIMVDGQETRYIGRSAHWPIARQIAAELATRPGEGPRVAAWYRATAAVLQQWRDLDLLGMHLEAGQTLFVDDPVLALYQGTLRQTFGDPRLQKYLQRRGSTDGYGRAPGVRAIEPGRDRETGGISRGRVGGAMLSGPPPQAPARLARTTRVELGIAEREFRRALTLDPTLHEARIRLAHVLSRLGDD